MTTSPILATKLFTPPPNSTEVSRPRLLESLNRGQQAGQRLALVCAPAGYGKTTLVGEWIHTLTSATAWLSLDPADNDPNLFLLGSDGMDSFKQTTETLHRLLPNSRVAVLPGQQHSAMLTAPDLFAKEVTRFLLATDRTLLPSTPIVKDIGQSGPTPSGNLST